MVEVGANQGHRSRGMGDGLGGAKRGGVQCFEHNTMFCPRTTEGGGE